MRIQEDNIRKGNTLADSYQRIQEYAENLPFYFTENCISKYCTHQQIQKLTDNLPVTFTRNQKETVYYVCSNVKNFTYLDYLAAYYSMLKSNEGDKQIIINELENRLKNSIKMRIFFNYVPP